MCWFVKLSLGNIKVVITKMVKYLFYKISFILIMLLCASAFGANNKKLTKEDIIQQLLPKTPQQMKQSGYGKAPINIALCKYWGKRNKELNLPQTSSISIALPYYTTTTISIAQDKDRIFLNGKEVSLDSEFGRRTIDFLNLIRQNKNIFLKIETNNDLPTSAGLASSASGFAAFVIALNDIFNWNLTNEKLSILARMGSGSAARSIPPGFVYWQAGKKADGTDSYATEMYWHLPPQHNF
ncbi:diphosphomevalonate decarboxylase [Holospora undulata HU1]|uniref:Diphosphomevalonate decarboxylase n=1 Tax=Holospora undulata HU1 TaxID=1321371 RepID=A0A061JIL8_9PROT|nr:diphosphomevalonate decarboxylase [Holospora undulata HU1]